MAAAMTDSITPDRKRNRRRPYWRLTTYAAVTLMLTLLIVAVGLVALASGTGAIPLPYEMFLLEQRMPIVFRAHMITSALALVFTGSLR